MEVVDLPPGFRFHPTDEEIITFYLTEKVINGGFSATAIGEADLNKCEPWDLPQMAKMGEKEWYFFCQRDRKYPTGMRTNRATESGYWKATGKDKEIFQGKSGCLAGMKKTLVFYKGRAPKGQKTNWVMHEYRLEGKFSYHHHLPKSAKNEWVVCRVFHKNVTAGFKRLQIPVAGFSSVLPPLVDPTNLINVETGGFDDGVLKGSSARSIRSSIDDGYYDLKYFSVGANEQPIRNFSPLPTNSSAGGMMINVSQRSNNNPEFLYPKMAPVSPSDSSFSSEKMMNYYVPEQQPMGSRPVVTAAATGFVDIGCGTAEQLVSSSSLDQTMRRYCKMEQLSSTQQSMMSVSQDTGLSADVNNTTEISSVDAARRILGEACYDDFNGAGAISDLDQLWEY